MNLLQPILLCRTCAQVWSKDFQCIFSRPTTSKLSSAFHYWHSNQRFAVHLVLLHMAARHTCKCQDSYRIFESFCHVKGLLVWQSISFKCHSCLSVDNISLVIQVGSSNTCRCFPNKKAIYQPYSSMIYLDKSAFPVSIASLKTSLPFEGIWCMTLHTLFWLYCFVQMV